MPAQYEEQLQRTDAPASAPSTAAAAAPDFVVTSASVHGNQRVSRQLSANGGATPFRPGLGTGLALARAAGNPAGIASAAARGGSPLPSSASAASDLLGSAASDVRVHHGATADAKLAARPGALAVTEGSDIHVGSAAPALDSPSGRLLIAHEAAHVLQQKAAGPDASGEHSEQEADDAAVAASLGRPVGTLSAATGPQFFEAPKHAATLKTAMDSHGFSDAEQDAAYFGNWCRDLSQALVPTLTDKLGSNMTFQVVNMLAIRHFGHGVTPAQLGAYDPREHIDNPAGTTDRDVVKKEQKEIAGYHGDDPITHTPSGTARTGTEGDTTEDKHTQDLSPDNIAKSFEVNAAGVPAYIDRSKQYILTEYKSAVKEGRNKAGLYHLGNFSHTCQDLFAHSNFVEMAVGRLIKEGSVNPKTADDKIKLPAEARKEANERIKAGMPPVEDYAAEVTDKQGQARPILQTGTFTGGAGTGNKSGHDTFISLSAEVKNLVGDLNPFRDKDKTKGDASEWDFAMEVLNHMDEAGDDGSLGEIMVGCLEPVIGKLDGLTKPITDSADSLKGKARSFFGKGTMGDLAEGAAGLVGKGTHAVLDPATAKGKDAFKELIKSIANGIGEGGVSLAKLAVWYQKAEGAIADTWKKLKEGVKELPAAIREAILPELVAAEHKFKRKIQELGTAAWNKATAKLLQDLAAAAKPTSKNETNVDHKMEVWAADLSKYMKEKYLKINDKEPGQKCAGAVPDYKGPADVQAIMGAGNVFPANASDLAKKTAEAGGNLAELETLAADSSKDVDNTVHQLAQLSNVPEWARAGASHSQIAKDHAGDPFFGLAFKLANDADKKLIGILKDAWGDKGETGPNAAEGLDKNYGSKYDKDEKDEKDPDKVHHAGEQKVDEHGSPVLEDEEGLTEWQKQARREFLRNRMEGEAAIKKGKWEAPDIGPSLNEVADAFVGKIKATPILGKYFDPFVQQLRTDKDTKKLMEALERAKKGWSAYAESGDFDDDLVMGEVDNLVSRAHRILEVAGRGETCADHGPDCHDPANSCPEHGHGCADPQASCPSHGHGCNEQSSMCPAHGHACDGKHDSGGKDDGHGHAEGGDVHTKEQIELLNKYRTGKTEGHKGPTGPGGVDEKAQVEMRSDHSPVLVTQHKRLGPTAKENGKDVALNKMTHVGEKSELDKKAEAAKTADEKFEAELNRIFGHPYDTNWWVPTVQAWAKDHQDDLGRFIRERNSGKAHVH